jgi:hypothetical protein
MTAELEAQAPLDDLVVVERTAVPRSVVGTAGCFTISRCRDSKGKLVIFSCTVVKMSAMAAAFSTSAKVEVGDWVVASFEHLGEFEGPILQVTKRQVLMRIVATQQDRDKVAAKLAWIEDKDHAERRRFERFVPDEPQSTVSLSSGETLPCTVIDYSITGVAVFADLTPAEGTALKIAKLLGRVVRRFSGGFAVNFITVQPDPQSVASQLRDAAASRAD